MSECGAAPVDVHSVRPPWAMNVGDQPARLPSVTIERPPPFTQLLLAGPMVGLPLYRITRRVIAHHEAAHAVLCSLFGLRIRNALIRADNSGLVDLVRPSAPPVDRPIPRAMLETAAVQIASMYLAGVMAELLLCGQVLDGRVELDIPDWRNARRVLVEVFECDVPLFFCQRYARYLLSKHWGWVRAVAAELMVRGTVSTEDIERLRT